MLGNIHVKAACICGQLQLQGGKMNQKKKSSSLYHYLIIATGIVLCLAPSALPTGCAGIFYPSIVEYLQVSRASLAIYMTIQGLALTAFLPFAGKMMQKYDARVLLSGAVILIGGTMIAMSFFNAIWQWYIAGVPLGMGIAFTMYLAVPTLIGRWFKDKVGFFIGLCMAFTGIGGVVFNYIGGLLIATGPEGWRMGYLVFGAVTLALSLPFTLFAVRSFPADKGLVPFGITEESSDEKGGEVSAPSAPVLKGVSAKFAMRSPVFFLLCGFSLLITLSAVFFQFIPTYAVSLKDIAPAVAAAAATAASVVALGQAVGKLGLGIVNDKNIYIGLVIGIVCGLVGFVLLWLLPTNLIIVFIGSFLFGVLFALVTVQTPLMTRTIFGMREYSGIYSRVSMVFALSVAIGATLWGAMIDYVGFTAVFVTLIVMTIIGAIMGFYALKRGERLEHTTE